MLWAETDLDYRVIRRVVEAAAREGYANLQLVVRHADASVNHELAREIRIREALHHTARFQIERALPFPADRAMDQILGE